MAYRWSILKKAWWHQRADVAAQYVIYDDRLFHIHTLVCRTNITKIKSSIPVVSHCFTPSEGRDIFPACSD